MALVSNRERLKQEGRYLVVNIFVVYTLFVVTITGLAPLIETILLKLNLLLKVPI